MRSFICFFLLFCTSFISNAQMRQLSYYTGTELAEINDSKIDHSGNIVSVGNYIDPVWGPYDPFILKTDKSGYVIWFHKIAFNIALSWSFNKIEFARNGDYLLTMNGPHAGFYRTDSNGTMICMRKLTYQCNADGPLSVAELPDGRLLFCGETCHFDGNDYYKQGLLLLTDSSASNPEWQREYRNDDGPMYMSYGFYDVAVDSNRFYIAGHASPWGLNRQYGFFLVMDYNGNLLRKDMVMYSPTSSPGNVTSFLNFEEINIFNNGIYLSGTIKSSSGLEKFVMGKIDTVAETFTGNIISAGNYEMFRNPRVNMYESGNYYLSGNAKPNYATTPKKYFISKIEGENQIFTKKITQDSAINIKSIYSYNDTLLLAGSTKSVSSMYLAYMETNAGSFTCGVQDTILTFEPFLRTLEEDFSILYAPFYTSGGFWLEMDTLQTYGILLCGDTICGSDSFNPLIALTDTTICEGDTTMLLYDNVGQITWYKDGTPIPFSGTQLSATQSGLYSTTYFTYDGCNDTSTTIYVNVLPAPVPVIQQNGDELISSAAVTYQWYAQGSILIPGATQQNFIPTVTGNYYVVVSYANGCNRTSSIMYLQPTQVLNNASRNDEVLIYPNPAVDILNIFNPAKGAITIDIFDMSGRSVYATSLTSGYHCLKTKEMKLAPGIYMLKVLDGKSDHVYKVVIQ